MSSRRAPARWQSPWPFYAGRRIEDQRRTRRTVTKLRLKAPSKTEPRQSERIFVTRRPFGPQLRQLLKPNTCLNRTDIGFRRCLSARVSLRAPRVLVITTEDAEDAEVKSRRLTGFFLLSSVSSVVEFSFLRHAPRLTAVTRRNLRDSIRDPFTCGGVTV